MPLDAELAGPGWESAGGFGPEDIRRAMSQLTFGQRSALVLRELEGRTYAEIAGILGISQSAVETLLFRARRAFREQLEGALGCGQAERAISRQLDGRLARAERAALRARLRACPDCASLARRARSERSALRGIAWLPLPQSLATFSAAGGSGAAVGATAGGGLGLKAVALGAAAPVAAGAGTEVARRVSAHPAPSRLAAPAPPVVRAPAPVRETTPLLAPARPVGVATPRRPAGPHHVRAAAPRPHPPQHASLVALVRPSVSRAAVEVARSSPPRAELTATASTPSGHSRLLARHAGSAPSATPTPAHAARGNGQARGQARASTDEPDVHQAGQQGAVSGPAAVQEEPATAPPGRSGEAHGRSGQAHGQR